MASFLVTRERNLDLLAYLVSFCRVCCRKFVQPEGVSKFFLDSDLFADLLNQKETLSL